MREQEPEGSTYYQGAEELRVTSYSLWTVKGGWIHNDTGTNGIKQSHPRQNSMCSHPIRRAASSSSGDSEVDTGHWPLQGS